METGDTFLTQQSMDFCFWEQSCERLFLVTPHGPLGIGHNVKQKNATVADVLTQGRIHLLETGEISAWLGFGYQILLGIHDILGSKVSEGWKTLEHYISRFRSTINYKLQDGILRFPAKCWPSEGGGELAGEFCQRLEMARSGTFIGHQVRKEIWLEYGVVSGTEGVESTTSVNNHSLRTLRQSVQTSSAATARTLAVSPSREGNFLSPHSLIYVDLKHSN